LVALSFHHHVPWRPAASPHLFFHELQQAVFPRRQFHSWFPAFHAPPPKGGEQIMRHASASIRLASDRLSWSENLFGALGLLGHFVDAREAGL
jgi:hypothetical protein